VYIHDTHNILMHICIRACIWDRFGIHLSEENTERTDESLMLTAKALGGTKNLDIGFVRAIKNHDPDATAAAKAARKATSRKTFIALALNTLPARDTDGLSEDVLIKRGFACRLAGGKKCKGMRYADILVIAHKVRRWAGQGGRKYDAYKREIEKRMLDRGLTEEEAVAELKELKGKDRHAYDLLLDRRSFGGQGGRKYDAYKREIEKRMLDRGLSEQEAVAELKELKGKDRHAYDLLLDRRSFGGQGGRKYDAYNEEIEKRMLDRGLSEQEAAAELKELKGKDRHAYDLLLDRRSFGGNKNVSTGKLIQAAAVYAAALEELYSVLVVAATEITPDFDIDAWAQRVRASTQGKKRLEEFNVHINSVYRKLAQDIPKMKEYPAKPVGGATAQAKASWRTNCANFMRDELIERDMLPTFMYWRWADSPAWQRQLMEARNRT
jgi:hypothetical protein